MSDALSLSEERWQLVMQANNDAIWDWDARTNTVFHSPRWGEMLGYSEDELPNSALGWEDFLHPDDAPQVIKAIDDYLERRTPSYSGEFRLRARDNSWRWVLARAQAVWDEHGRVLRMVGTHTDITDRKELEAELHRKQRELEERNLALETASSSKSELLSRMSHEFRTPLNAIIGFSQILRDLTTVTNEQAEYVDEILKGAGYLLALINELLDMVRIEAGKLALSIEPIPAVVPLAEAIDLVRPLASDKRICIDVDDASLKECILADLQRVKQICLNLLSNAIKYNKEGGRVAVRGAVGEDSYFHITFEDGGIGIPAEKMHRLFSPFDRLGAEQYGIEGTGLGLAVTKRLVEAMNGTLHVESTEGVGSSFTIGFPMGNLAEFDEEPANDLSQNHGQQEPNSGGDYIVLYIEDNLANLKLVQKILKKRPAIRLISAMKGGLGLELAREYKPDCVLLDVHLPDLLGSQVLERLREDPATAGTPVIVLSADATIGQRKRLLANGASEYLTKPIDVKQFLTVLDSVLSQI